MDSTGYHTSLWAHFQLRWCLFEGLSKKNISLFGSWIAVLDIMYICVNWGKPDVRPLTASGPIPNAKNQCMFIEFILVLLSDGFIGWWIHWVMNSLGDEFIGWWIPWGMNSWELCSSQPTALGQTWCALVVYNSVGETGHNPVAELYIYLTCSVILVSSRVWPVLEIWSPLSMVESYLPPCLECKVHEHPIGGHLGESHFAYLELLFHLVTTPWKHTVTTVRW